MDPWRAPAPPRKIVLATLGTLGDINPFIALAIAIQARGLDAVIVAPAPFGPMIEAAGIGFMPLRPSIQDVCAAVRIDFAGVFRVMRVNPHFILDEVYMRFLRETYEDVLQAATGAAAILTQSLLVGAHLAAETLRLPTARVVLAPLHVQSAASPSVTPLAPYIPPRIPGALYFNRLVRGCVRASVAMRVRRLHAFRTSIGLPRTNEDFFLDFGRLNQVAKVFGLFSPVFAPAQSDQPRNLEVVGFPFVPMVDTSRRALDPALQVFLSAGEAPIVFTLGSVAPNVSGAFYDVGVRAAQTLGRRCVLLAGTRDAARLMSGSGPDVFVCESAPHDLLFPQSLCVVHHGGIGTTAEAMRAGKPHVVVPFFGDQFDNAARVRRLGLGALLALPRFCERRAVDALKAAMRDDVVRRAERFAATIESDSGVEGVADWVETVVGSPCAAA